MLKFVGLVCTLLLPLILADSPGDKFAKYKAVEAYEIRPGILMMPQYAEDGQVCEIGLERRQYSPDLIRLDSEMSREEIDRIAGDLAPLDERGPKSNDLIGSDLIDMSGQGMTTTSLYENVTIKIFSRVISTSKHHGTAIEDVAASIKWNKRKCQ